MVLQKISKYSACAGRMNLRYYTITAQTASKRQRFPGRYSMPDETLSGDLDVCNDLPTNSSYAGFISHAFARRQLKRTSGIHYSWPRLA